MKFMNKVQLNAVMHLEEINKIPTVEIPLQ